MRRRASLRIKGKVQGVYFRESARREALRLELSGWVRNRADGDVEAVAEGAEAAVAEFVAWCRHGPPTAQVLDLAVTESAAEGGFSTFSVER